MIRCLELTIGCQDEKKITGLLATIHDEIKQKINALYLPILQPHLIEGCIECGADLPRIPGVGEVVKCPSCLSRFHYICPGFMEIFDIKDRE